MPNDLSRLPKWAQEHIANLRRQIAERDVRITDLTTAIGPARDEQLIVADPFSDFRYGITATTVSIFHGTPDEVTVDVDPEAKVIELRSRQLGLVAYPRSSNVLRVKGNERGV